VRKNSKIKKICGASYGVTHEKGAGLIVVILVLAFLMTIGIVLLTVTGTGPRVSGNIRLQQQAFNAAEAGFDATWSTLENMFATEAWGNFEGHYLKEPTGIDIPTDANYFRKLTDEQLLRLIDPDGNGNPDVSNVIYFEQQFVPAGGGYDSRYTYTTFLIDDEAVGATPDPNDALLICIGVTRRGREVTTSRLEVMLAIELSGST